MGLKCTRKRTLQQRDNGHVWIEGEGGKVERSRVEFVKNRLILSQFYSTLLYSTPLYSTHFPLIQSKQITYLSFFLSIKLPLSLSLIFVFFSIFFWDIFISFNVGGKVRKNQRISAVSDLLLDGFYDLCPLSFVYSSEN